MYLSEYEFRYNNRELEDGERTTAAISSASNKAKTGPQPTRLKISGDWERAVGAVLTKKTAKKTKPKKKPA